MSSIPTGSTIIYQFCCGLYAFPCTRASKLNQQICNIMLMASCKTTVSPLLTHWSYIFLALTHRCYDGLYYKIFHYEYNFTYFSIKFLYFFFSVCHQPWNYIPARTCRCAFSFYISLTSEGTAYTNNTSGGYDKIPWWCRFTKPDGLDPGNSELTFFITVKSLI